MRAGKILQPVYEQIKERIKSSEHLTPDETGWRIGGHPAWLHGWVGDDGATLYAIDPQRSADVLEKVIGIDWSGSMTHDGFSSYERFEDAVHQQCVDHALRRARGLLDKQSGAAKIFPQQVIDLLTEALRLARSLRRRERPTDDRRGQRLRGLCRSRLLRLDRAAAHATKPTRRFAKHLYNHAAVVVPVPD